MLFVFIVKLIMVGLNSNLKVLVQENNNSCLDPEADHHLFGFRSSLLQMINGLQCVF